MDDCADVALIFPGQGAQTVEMLDGVRRVPEFAQRYSAVCDALGFRPDGEAWRHDDTLNSNATSSALTILVSSLSLDQYRRTHPPAAFMAGYSVGQWTALYAAGCVSFEDLLRLIMRRTACTDACFREREGGMMAVIGVAPERLEAFCEQLRKDGLPIFISNFNAYGQYSLAGTSVAIQAALDGVRALEPKRAVRLPVSGAWHSPLVAGASRPFAEYLETAALQLPHAIVINNVSGSPFPADIELVRNELVRHLTEPVRWDAGIRYLVKNGCRTFLEVGFGTTLTKFGFFIDRSVRHLSFYAANEGGA